MFVAFLGLVLFVCYACKYFSQKKLLAWTTTLLLIGFLGGLITMGLRMYWHGGQDFPRSASGYMMGERSHHDMMRYGEFGESK